MFWTMSSAKSSSGHTSHEAEVSCHPRKEISTWSSDALNCACLPTSMTNVLEALRRSDVKGSWRRQRLLQRNKFDADDIATAAVTAYLETKTRQAEALFEPTAPETDTPFV